MKIFITICVIAAIGAVALWLLAEDAISKYEHDDWR